MILDRLENADRYTALLPGLARAFDFLRRHGAGGLAALEPGRHAIDGDRVFALAARDLGRGHAASPLEAHRRYADVQFVAEGADEMGWRAVAECRREQSAPAGGAPGYDAAKDIVFYDETPVTWFRVPAGSFAVFFPEDAHAPLAGEGEVRKVVVKVAVE